MRLERWRGEDCDAIAALEEETQIDPWSPAQVAAAHVAGNLGWVVRAGGTLVAYALVLVAGDDLELLRIAVAPAFRRRGVARQLIETIVAEGRRLGMKRVLLEVRASNAAAMACYLRCGFEAIGRRRGYYAPPKGTPMEREDALVMAKTL